MESHFTSTDVVIVGGGMAGLSAAAYLARAGVSVTLYEKSADLGGRAATQDFNGYRFNRGLHALYTGGAADSALKELGISYTSNIPTKLFALRGGRFHLAPVDPLTVLRTSLFTAADKLEFMRVFAAIPRLNAGELATVSVQDWIAWTVRRPVVRQYVEAFARTFVYSAALHLVSADVFIDKTQRAFKYPIRYIDGGWGTLVDGLRRAAEAAGARVVSGARVESVEHHAGKVAGVKLRDGSIMRAAAVIVATLPHEAARLVDHPALRRVVDGLLPAQIACLDVALSRLPDPQYPIVQDMDHARFITAQSVYSRVTPPGGAMICVAKQLDPTRPTDPQEDERELEGLLDTVHPGWRDALVKRVYMPRIDAMGTLPTAQAGGRAGRPDSQISGIAGLYLAGDWVGSEGFLVDASMASARRAARLLIDGNLAALRAEQHPMPVMA